HRFRKSRYIPSVAKVEVLIVGAGSTGLFLANELASFMISFRIIDSSRSAFPFAKGMGLSARTLEILNNRNMLESFLKKGRPLNSYTLNHEGTKVGSFPIFGSDTPFPFILLLSENEVAKTLEQELEKQLKRESIVEYSTTLVNYSETKDGVTAFLRHANDVLETVECQYIIGCDDVDSAVRMGYHSDWGYEANSSIGLWVLGDMTINSTDISDEEVTFFLHNEGLLSFYPFQSHNRRFRVVANIQDIDYKKVQLHGEDTPTGKTLSTSSEKQMNPKFSMLPFTELESAIKVRASSAKVTVETATWMSYFSPMEGQANGFRRGRAFLCGDAAHSHSPTSGFGHDLGIQDAHNLAWKLFLVLTKQSSNYEKILDSYSAEREPIAAAAIWKTVYVNSLLATQGNMLDTIRTYLVSKMSNIQLFSQLIQDEVLQTNIHYDQSPIIKYLPEYSDRFVDYFETKYPWPTSSLNPLRVYPGYHLPDTTLRSLKIHPGKDTFTLYSKMAENVSFVLLLLTSTHSILPKKNVVFMDFLEVISCFSEVIRPMVIALPSAVEYAEMEEFSITCPNCQVGVEPSGQLHSYVGCKPGEMMLVLVRPDLYIASILKTQTYADITVDLKSFLRSFLLDRGEKGNSKIQ
ncbi:hypothetical protein K7432_012960, partial [Basidiobolus ranarum]